MLSKRCIHTGFFFFDFVDIKGKYKKYLFLPEKRILKVGNILTVVLIAYQ